MRALLRDGQLRHRALRRARRVPRRRSRNQRLADERRRAVVARDSEHARRTRGAALARLRERLRSRHGWRQAAADVPGQRLRPRHGVHQPGRRRLHRAALADRRPAGAAHRARVLSRAALRAGDARRGAAAREGRARAGSRIRSRPATEGTTRHGPASAGRASCSTAIRPKSCSRRSPAGLPTIESARRASRQPDAAAERRAARPEPAPQPRPLKTVLPSEAGTARAGSCRRAVGEGADVESPARSARRHHAAR